MTSLLERVGRPTRTAPTVLTGRLPQVNLLPPEIRTRRQLRSIKRRLALVVLLVLVIATAAALAARLAERDAQASLDAAQQRTSALQTEAQKYVEVPQITGELDQIRQARSAALSDEVLWAGYYGAVAAVMPTGMTIDSLQVTVGNATASGASSASTTTDALGTMTFVVRSATVPDTATFLDALAKVPGLADPTVNSVAYTEGSGSSYYAVTGTGTVTSGALSHRFATDGKN